MYRPLCLTLGVCVLRIGGDLGSPSKNPGDIGRNGPSRCCRPQKKHTTAELLPGQSNREALPGEGCRVKGRGWVVLGGGVGRFRSQQRAGKAFRRVGTKTNLFVGIRRCEFLFAKVSHSVFQRTKCFPFRCLQLASLRQTASNGQVHSH